MRETITYLEMTAEDALLPAAEVPGLTLEPLDRDSPLIPEIQARIGAPHGWKSATRTAEDWAAWFAAHPERRFWTFDWSGEAVGLLVCDVHPGPEVEIETFGLVPEFVGKGLGGHTLTLGISAAWRLVPEVRRVWLHTSSLDHPSALPNYLRRGLRVFRTEEIAESERGRPV